MMASEISQKLFVGFTIQQTCYRAFCIGLSRNVFGLM